MQIVIVLAVLAVVLVAGVAVVSLRSGRRDADLEPPPTSPDPYDRCSRTTVLVLRRC